MNLNPVNRASKIANKFESKAARIVAFWSALAGLIALIPTIASILYGAWTFGTHLYYLDSYVTEFTEVSEYLVFQVGQNTRMINAEADAKISFGVPVRMTNPPKEGVQGDLWYSTYTKIGDKWYLVTYKAQPYMTDSEVHFFDYKGNWIESVDDLDQPTKNDIKAN